MNTETRTVEMFQNVEPLEVRAAEGDKPAKVTGYAAVFDSLSADLGGFREKIKPGAFRTSLDSGRDVRALVDHDHSKLLGRTMNRTLRLGENAKGLWFEVDLPDTTYARDLIASVKRGDIRGASFGFLVPKDGDKFYTEGKQTIRELLAIDLREVTVTSVPAYNDTAVAVRIDPAVIQRVAAENSARPNFAKCMASYRMSLVKGA
jgi:HK97 family phage prohead protease